MFISNSGKSIYKIIKNSVAVFVAFGIVVTLFNMNTEAAVTENGFGTRINNFVTSGYVSEGDQVKDLINFASKQVGKSGSDLGYDENWCAAFVSDCARYVGCNWTWTKSVSAFKNMGTIIYSRGGSLISDPKPGDLVILDWDLAGSDSDHVEIVSGYIPVSQCNTNQGNGIIGGIISIGGNTGDSNYAGNVVKVRENAVNTNWGKQDYHDSVSYIIRPNYEYKIIASGSYAEYDWSVNANGLLKVECKDKNIDLTKLQSVSSDVLTSINSVIFDISSVTLDEEGISLTAFGGCLATSVRIIGRENITTSLWLSEFQLLTENGIAFPKGWNFKCLGFQKIGISSTDFIKDYKVEELTIHSCYMKNATIPNTVKRLRVYSCSFLETLTLPSTLESVILSDLMSLNSFNSPKDLKGLFCEDIGCSKILVPQNASCMISGDKIESVQFASGRTEINSTILADCKGLKSVYLPVSVTSIDASAFINCKALENVYFEGTRAQWSQINVTNSFGNWLVSDSIIWDAVVHYDYGSQSIWGNEDDDTQYDDDYGYPATGFTTIDGKTYYIDDKGKKLTGWQTIAGYRYCFDLEDGHMYTYSHRFPNGDWYIFGEDGRVLSGWNNLKGHWLYSNENGYFYFGRSTVNGQDVYFDYNGSLLTKWQTIDGYTFLFDDEGHRLTGWQQINGEWYYLDPKSGTMRTSWLEESGRTYYLEPTGQMKTGWKLLDEVWRFFNSDGSMKTGWLKDNGKWYYLEPSGEMVTGWSRIGGKWYYFNSDGSMKTGWILSDKYWYYLKSDGSMASSEYINGYWLDADGRWTYQAVASWKYDWKGWYYIDTRGWYAKNASYKIDGKVYNFDKSGYCTNPYA